MKQLSVASHQGKNQFVTEIATISAVQHRNLVKLYGCCIEGNRRLLVYEYLENKSLDQALFGMRTFYNPFMLSTLRNLEPQVFFSYQNCQNGSNYNYTTLILQTKNKGRDLNGMINMCKIYFLLFNLLTG